MSREFVFRMMLNPNPLGFHSYPHMYQMDVCEHYGCIDCYVVCTPIKSPAAASGEDVRQNNVVGAATAQTPAPAETAGDKVCKVNGIIEECPYENVSCEDCEMYDHKGKEFKEIK